MSTPIPSTTALPAGLGNVPDPAQPATAAVGTVPPAAAVPAAAPAPAAMPPATSIQWSAQALQELRLQAFEQLIAQLALQVQAQAPGQPLAPAWPAQGVSAPLQQWLQTLLLQVAVQGQPLQMLAAQPGSAALIQALAQAQAQGSQPGNAQASALRTAAALSPTLAAALQAAATPAAASSATASAAPAMPPLQNWWVQQGTVLTPQGERGFTLTLQVPVAWAQSMGGAAPAGGSPQAAAPALRLPWPDSTPLPASGPVALVLQPQGNPAAARTSALLWLEFQSAPVGAAHVDSATTVAPGSAGLPLFAPAPALAQEVQQLLQNKSDPWLLMAAAQAANALPLQRRGGEHRSHLCATEGCQYQGLAPCAQPFCSEMNRIWAATGVARSG
ncbi:Fe-S oxidoreductase [Comamonas guangdongensis]|uniref:Fe-S oxidoreductase n=1 Tax=Comamonas guangdongensis TaxID=510515 RepID=A0ABV3ZT73_9BURK